MKTIDDKKADQIRTGQDAFIRHLEQSTEKVCSWPKWKQGLLGVSIDEKRCRDSARKK